MAILKPRPFDKADRDYEKNFGALNDHIEDRDFKTWIGARSFNVDTTGATKATEGGYAAAPYWEYADGVTQRANTAVYSADYWRVGRLGLTIYYTGDVGSTNKINWNTRISGFAEDGAALNTPVGDITTTSDDFANGPAGADDLKLFSIPEANWLAWTADYPLISIVISRIGGSAGDTYTGVGRLLGVLLRYYPTRR